MWTKLDDHFLSNGKIRAIGPEATLLYLAGLLHCARNLTDGRIRRHDLPLIAAEAWTPQATLPALIHTLETPDDTTGAPLWDKADHGWIVHDYLDFNPPADRVKRERLAARERRKRSDERRAHLPRTSPPPSPDVTPPHTPSATPIVHSPRPVPVPVPVPARPDPEQAHTCLPSTPATLPPSSSDPPNEIHHILAILREAANPTSLQIIQRALDTHPHTDPIDVALDYADWQARQRLAQDAGKTARVHKNRLRGWARAMESAAARGFYRRLPQTHPVQPTPTPDPAPRLPPLPDPPSSFTALLTHLETALPPDAYALWIASLLPGPSTDTTLTLLATDDNHVQWLRERFHTQIQRALATTDHPHLTPAYAVAAPPP